MDQSSHVTSTAVLVGVKMLFNATLFTAFNDSMEALVAGIRAQTSGLTHNLAHVPAMRDSHRETTQSLLDEISVLSRQIEATQKSLASAQIHLVQIQSQIHMTIAPIGLLPVELMQRVIMFTVEGFANHAQIILVSHISRQWRAAVLGISELFKYAKWKQWGDEALQEWCTRAGAQPLSITLEPSLLEHPDKASILTSSSDRWSNINVHPCWTSEPSRFTQSITELLARPTPKLDHLTIFAFHINTESTFDLCTDNAPLLKLFCSFGLRPRVQGSLSGVTELGCAPRSTSDWLGWTELIHALPALTQLTIWKGNEVQSTAITAWPNLAIPSLTSLAFKRVNDFNDEEIIGFLNSLAAPKLRKVSLWDSQSSFRKICAGLVSTATGSQIFWITTYVFTIRQLMRHRFRR